MPENLTKKQSAALLAALVIARSTSFMFSKMLLQSLSTYSILSLRFITAFAIMLVIFRKRLREINPAIIKYGTILGVFYTAIMTLELSALKTCATSAVSFVQNSAIVIVPVISFLVTKEKPKLQVILGCIVAVAGVALLTVFSSGGTSDSRLFLCVISATVYAGAIFLTGIFSRRENPLLIGLVQIGSISVLTTLAALITGTLSYKAPPVDYLYVLLLAVICSCFGFTLQPAAQKNLDTNISGMFCALAPLSTALLGILFLHERFTLTFTAGCVLILAGFFISNKPEKIN